MGDCVRARRKVNRPATDDERRSPGWRNRQRVVGERDQRAEYGRATGDPAFVLAINSASVISARQFAVTQALCGALLAAVVVFTSAVSAAAAARAARQVAL